MHHFGTPGCCWRDPGTSRIGVEVAMTERIKSSQASQNIEIE